MYLYLNGREAMTILLFPHLDAHVPLEAGRTQRDIIGCAEQLRWLVLDYSYAHRL
jgi:hypothetical protein